MAIRNSEMIEETRRYESNENKLRAYLKFKARRTLYGHNASYVQIM